MDVMENWRTYATICRLCLQKDGYMLGIFNHIRGKDKSIYKKIIDCTALQISQSDGLPNVICHRCMYKIEFCLEFRKQCFLSDATLRQLNGTICGSANKENGADNAQSELQIQGAQLPLYEQLANGTGEDVVMVVDPFAFDYESDYETDNERQSDAENLENGGTFGGQSVSMCKYCDYAFTDRAACADHENTAHNCQVPYSCSLCDMSFGDRLQYSAHLKGVHQNDKPYNCPQCDRSFARRSDLRKHTVVHTGIKPFTCSVCSKSFSRNTNLSKHMRIHSGRKPFVCTKCPKTFFSKGDLTRHAIIHSGQKPFNCAYCHLGFGRKDKLLRHEKRHINQDTVPEKKLSHETSPSAVAPPLPSTPPSITNNYDQSASAVNNDEENREKNISTNQTPPSADWENMVIGIDPYNLNNYSVDNIKSEHELESPSVTNKTPTTPTADEDKTDDTIIKADTELPQVPDHITGDSFSNDPTKRFACDLCPKTFLHLENMRYHHATHSGVRPYSCNLCRKTFIRKREMDRHFATHTGQKPFECTKCPKSFGRKDKLVRHMRIHEESKEHRCDVCDSTFNRRDGLLHHMKSHEKIDEQPSDQ